MPLILDVNASLTEVIQHLNYLSGQIDTILELSKAKAVDTPQPPSEVDDSSNIVDFEAVRDFELPSARRYRLEAQLAKDKSKRVMHSEASLSASLEESDGQLAS
jgi:hypothetical protein